MKTPKPLPLLERLQCTPTGLSYDCETKTGTLFMKPGHCCNMTFCIELFQAIDPDVLCINTISGDVEDTIYRKRKHREGWSTFLHGKQYA